MVPLMVVYFFLQKYYRRSYVELQRCDATSRSPVYAHFSESLTGVETIRAFRYQEKFASKSDMQIDYNHRYCNQALCPSPPPFLPQDPCHVLVCNMRPCGGLWDTVVCCNIRPVINRITVQ